MELLTRKVLVLNAGWQAIAETDVGTALCDICRGQKRAIDTTTMLACTWETWIALPIRETDVCIRTTNRQVRVPTVVVTAYEGMPKTRPKLDRRGVAKRDKYHCAYTGEYAPDGTLDHVMPRSRGGGNTWTNLVWSRKDINHRKANRTPEEAGLKLRIKPVVPKEVIVALTITPKHPDWEPFMLRRA